MRTERFLGVLEAVSLGLVGIVGNSDVKPNQGSGRKEPNMLIIGCDYHPSMQQIAFVDAETGERGERRLMHSDGEAERFYRELKQREVEMRMGMEATGHARWFERAAKSPWGHSDPHTHRRRSLSRS